MNSNASKPNYGIDAPHVVRNLFLFSLSLAGLAYLALFIQSEMWFWVVFLYTFPTAIILLSTGCWMLYGIKITKPRIAFNIIQKLELKGQEKVLDLGCGRGLLLCKIAQYLPQGMAYGVDLWSSKDQSGNSLETTLRNADLAGVKNRVSVQTGDICSLSFEDDFFDAVVSSLCLHNIKDKQQREKALLEMLRVLKPEGRFAIADIQHGRDYATFLSSKGLRIECSRPNYAYCPPITIIEGCKR